MLCRSDPSVSFSCANCDEYVVHWMVKVQLTIVHAFIISRLNYGNAILPNAPRTWTDKLRRFLNAAARVISGTRKFDRDLTHILHDDLHWLDVPQRVIFKLCMEMYVARLGTTVSQLNVLVTDAASRRNYAVPSKDLRI